MENEKIYYALLVLLCAVSMLMSPFFFIRRNRHRVAAADRRWRTIGAVNLLAAAGLAALWYFVLR
ncbi:hypothetical protein [Neisseria leonii]|uniref:hypothetical protein n=1 Tax=Neisseria leonii TaxID=2995413 RepID=UPI00237A1A26|nr:hypothetical protein [Neisseria sp. 3986]MDD9325484.1 hypothetical protein [Neisseria sp. 3986]